ERVELARVGMRGNLMRERDELVRRVAHRGENTHDAVSALAGRDEAPRDSFEAVGTCDRSAAELHDDRYTVRRALVCGDRGDGLVGRFRHAAIVGTACGYISRRPESARPSVTSSAYSRSPPTGRPLASRVTRTRPRDRKSRYAAVASPVMFGFVASTTSCPPWRSPRPSTCVSTSWSAASAPTA